MPFTFTEVKSSLFQMHPTKAPHMDGLHALLFQKLWPIVGCTVTSACFDVFNNNGSLGEIN